MNSNQVLLVGENGPQTDIYISVIIPTLMTDSCDVIPLHGDTEVAEVVFLTSVFIFSSLSHIKAELFY